MQSVPVERSTTSESYITDSDLSTQTTQHGLHGNHEPDPGHVFGPGSVAGSTASSEVDALSTSSGSSGSSVSDRRADIRRLNSHDDSPRGSSNLNRIDEYERSRVGTPQRQQHILFQIVPSKEGGSNVSIDDFPNEVLTHLLSHLSPSSLSSMSLVSKRFHTLITTPHAWRIAFSRYFPGPESLLTTVEDPRYAKDDQQILRSDRRAFSRLSALASWRSEYILRTRLLRSLARGKPSQFQSLTRSGHPRHSSGAQATAVTTYGSSLLYPVSHIHATFGTGLNKKQPLFMHGASEQGIVTASDPALGKVDNWGVNDHQAFKHFADLYIGDAEYGLGPGDVVGMPNVMDLSQQYGRVYGEACPGGRVFYTSIGEQRGRFLQMQSSPDHDLGIPEVTMLGCAVTSVWITKSESVLKLTSGIFGMLAGFSNGVLSAYALGSSPVYDRRYDKGEPTAKWVLSPGVPIISIKVDENLSSRRQSQRRIWVVVMNALGEVFYLTDVPSRPDTKPRLISEEIDRVAWVTGRSCSWSLIDNTQRTARLDPFNSEIVDGSYSPRSSSDGMELSKEQIIVESREIEKFLAYRPKHFRKVCEGWDMRRILQVDFAGNDRHGAGESIIIISPGLDEDTRASIRRLTRRRLVSEPVHASVASPAVQSSSKRPSLFGGPSSAHSIMTITPTPKSGPDSRTSSSDSVNWESSATEWYMSDFTFGGLKSCQVSISALDESMYAVLTVDEDPLLGMNGGSSASSPMSSPFSGAKLQLSPSEVPGQRGRYLAVGLMTGLVLLWDIRTSTSPATDIVNSVSPIRIIYTESPQISCLAVTSLYVVHGGNDGLVQAWDPLASTTQPIRTLNSRFSSRARRRLMQAEMSIHGVGNNYYAAGAMVLDPDPTVLRGMVSLGTHLRYWSYNSSATDQFKSSKRQLRRRSERGSNVGHAEQRYTHTGRGALKDYITNEKLEMEREKIARRKELEHLSGRFGTDLLGPGASEEEMIAYATILSEESYSSDQVNRSASSRANSAVSSASSDTVPINDSSKALFDTSLSGSSPPTDFNDADVDQDVAEAIRLSLMDQQAPSTTEGDPTSSISTSSYYDTLAASDVTEIPIRYSKKLLRNTPSSPPRPSSSQPTPLSEGSSVPPTHSPHTEDDELDFAIRLSLAEEESRKAAAAAQQYHEMDSPHFGDAYHSADDYPALERNITALRDNRGSPSNNDHGEEGEGKGKGKGKAAWN